MPQEEKRQIDKTKRHETLNNERKINSLCEKIIDIKEL
jgi:hypothetical protein